MVTANDSLSIFKTKIELEQTTEKILNSINPFLEYKIEDTRRVSKEKRLIELEEARKKGSVNVNYKPFDVQFMYHTKNNEHWINSPRNEVMQHFLLGKNIGLVIGKQCVGDWKYVFCTNVINVFNLTGTAGRFGSGNTFPLYLYPETSGQLSTELSAERIPNLNLEIVNKIAKELNLKFTAEKTTTNSPPLEGCPQDGVVFAPIDLLDYIYGVLHSPTHREKYKEFLTIDFPKIPYPKDLKTFWKLVELGSQIREIHLLESATVENYITEFNIDGDCVVTKPRYENSPPPEGCPQDGVVNHLTQQIVFINKTPIQQNPVLELPYNPKLKERARELRQAENLSEVLFWMQVTKGGFHKIDFDRQRIIGNYIVDFYVKKLGLVIEIDGASHDNKEKYDAEREAYLISLGLKVYHIPVTEVLQNMKVVMKNLELFIIKEYRKPPDSSLHIEVEPPRPLGTPPTEGNLKTNSFGRVYINETQYFENVPEVAWNFYIGGYQPAQKWLKDRKGRKLEFDDIVHYQKIIVTLSETDRIMKEIDTIEIENC